MKKIISFLTMSLLLAMILVTGAEASQGKELKRLSGQNRVHTSIEISKEAYVRAENVILVGYRGEVDALTGSVLARAKDAPVLFVNEKYLKDVKKRLVELKTKNVYILGGEGVFSQKLYKEFKDYNPTRIKGNNRYHTAVEVAKAAIGETTDEVFLALGVGNYADALAVGSISAKSQKPLLLAGKGVLPRATKDALRDMKVKKVNIVGGTNAISQTIEDDLKTLNIETARTSGNSREETSIELAKEFSPNHSSAVIANGWKYADAVVGGYFAAVKDAPILLTKEDDLKDALTNYLAKGNGQTYILGGQAVIDDYAYDLIKWSVEGQVNKKPEKLEEIHQDKIFTDKKEIRDIIVKNMEAKKDEFTITISPKFTLQETNELTKNLESDGSYYREFGIYLGSTKSSKEKIEINMYYSGNNNKEEKAFVDKEVKRIVSEIISPDMSEFQKVKAIHDYIVKNTDYSRYTIGAPYTDYTLLKEGKGVCQAYAMATSRFFEEVNIENVLVGGIVNDDITQGHAWNKVKVDGKWYNMDTTWDDPVGSSDKDNIRYRYFLISDEMMSIDHTERIKDIKMPEAKDKKYEVLAEMGSRAFQYKESFYYPKNDFESFSGEIYKLSLSDLRPEKYLDVFVNELVIYDDTIYFNNVMEAGYLYSMDMDGSNIKQLNSVGSSRLKLEYPYIKYYAEYGDDWEKGLWEKIDIRNK